MKNPKVATILEQIKTLYAQRDKILSRISRDLTEEAAARIRAEADAATGKPLRIALADLDALAIEAAEARKKATNPLGALVAAARKSSPTATAGTAIVANAIASFGPEELAVALPAVADAPLLLLAARQRAVALEDKALFGAAQTAAGRFVDADAVQSLRETEAAALGALAAAEPDPKRRLMLAHRIAAIESENG